MSENFQKSLPEARYPVPLGATGCHFLAPAKTLLLIPAQRDPLARSLHFSNKSLASVSIWYKNGARGSGSSKSFENLFKSDRRLILTIINRLHAWDSHADTNRMRYRRFLCRFQYFTKDSLTNSTRWYPSGVSKAFLSKVLKSA